jgi:hypothetical protein
VRLSNEAFQLPGSMMGGKMKVAHAVSPVGAGVA